MTTLFQKLGNWLSGGVKFSRYSGYSLLNILSGTNINFDAKAGKRYDNSAVMAIISFGSRNTTNGPRLIVQQPIKGKRGREYKEVDSHEILDAVEDGPFFTKNQLYSGAILSLVVNGNGYWLKVRSKSSKVIGFIYLPHWQVVPKADKDFLDVNAPKKWIPDGVRRTGEWPVTYYELHMGDGSIVECPPSDIVHFRWDVDPQDTKMGLSPLFAALRQVCTDNEIATISYALLTRGGVLGYAISPDKIGEDDPQVNMDLMDKMGDKVRRYTTGDMAGTPVPFQFPIKVTQLGHKPSELVLDKQANMAVERILSQFGVDPMVLGLPSQSKTYSNFAEANEAAVRNFVLSILGKIADDLTSQCLWIDFKDNTQRFSRYRVAWDTSEIEALQPDIDSEAKRVREDFLADLITQAEARQERGYQAGTEHEVFYSEFKAGLISKPSTDSAPVEKQTLQQVKERRALRLAKTHDQEFQAD